MLDPDIPPVAEEGEADGGEDAARRVVADSPAGAIVNSTAESSPLPWITAIVPP